MKVSLFLVYVLFQIILISVAEKVRYDGYKVYRLTPSTKEHVEFLKELSEIGEVSFWEGPSKLMRSSDVMISPVEQQKILSRVVDSGIEFFEAIPDVQRLIDNEKPAQSRIQNNTIMFDFENYFVLNEVYNFLETLVAANGEIASVINIGRSFEDREIKVIKISKPGEGRRAIWLDSNIHAREWISGAVATYFINALLTNPAYGSWTDDFDFYILPYANPDGYEFTHSENGDRLWRMTRSTGHSEDESCVGVDPNRNFDYRWMEGGSSDDPCDSRQTYAGPRALSETETLSMTQFVETISEEMVFFGSIHSYSQIILMPYGVEGLELPVEEKAEFDRIAERMKTAIFDGHGTTYTSGSITDVLYPATGSSMDWAKGTFDTFLTLSFELRPGADMPQVGFVLPPDQIIPTGQEFLTAFQVIIDELRAEFISTEPTSTTTQITSTTTGPTSTTTGPTSTTTESTTTDSTTESLGQRSAYLSAVATIVLVTLGVCLF